MNDILINNGDEFVNEEMLEMQLVINIEPIITAAESPFQNDVCERNQVVNVSLSLTCEKYPRTPIQILLRWACMSKSTIQMIWLQLSSISIW